MVSIVVTGADGRTGQRLMAVLRGHPDVEAVVAADVTTSAVELKRVFEGNQAVVHLARATAIGSVLEAAAAAPVRTLVYRSSASVYGAWPNNPVPLTEDVPIRPNPGFTFAIEHGEAERRVAEWRESRSGVAAAILRPVPVVAPREESWESNTLGRPSRLRHGDSLPPTQFLHVDDATEAFAHAVLSGLDGTYNLAPDGFVSGETVRALARSGLTVPLPERLSPAVERWLWRLGWGGTPPEALPYLVHPWVVANDRLRATGWSPAYTNEEALVAARRGSWWRELSPQRRQELALGAVGVSGAASAGAAVVGARRVAKRRRTQS